jgi:hypothetical protein
MVRRISRCGRLRGYLRWVSKMDAARSLVSGLKLRALTGCHTDLGAFQGPIVQELGHGCSEERVPKAWYGRLLGLESGRGKRVGCFSL